MSGLTLHELGDERRVLDQFLVEAGGEETPEIKGLLDQLIGSTEQKVERWALWIHERELEAATIKAEAKRLSDRAAALANAAERSRGQLQYEMERQGIDKVRGTLITAAFQLNNPKVVGEVEEDVLRDWHQASDTNIDTPMTLRELVKFSPATYTLDRTAAARLAKLHPTLFGTTGLELVRERGLRIK